MKFVINNDVFQLFDTIRFGVVVGRISGEKENIEDSIDEMRKNSFASLNELGLQTSTLLKHPHISSWREAYRKFNVKAKKYKPTHEALVRRLLKDGTWPKINPIVNTYLTNQIQHILPHGGYDCSQLDGDLYLDISLGDEKFEPLGGGEELTSQGEIIYRDKNSILTRRWNYMDCDKTKITNNTKNFILMIEAPLNDVSSKSLEDATEDLKARYNELFSGSFKSKIFTANKNDNYFTLI